MPRGDGTGPTGQGPMTGHGSGFCILRLGTGAPHATNGFAGVNGKRAEPTTNDTSAYAPPSPKATVGHGKATADKKEVSQMPGGDGTGPMGHGPMTGKAAGFCAGNTVPGYMPPVPGRGYGMGIGSGRRFGRGLGWGFRGGHAGGGYTPYGGTPPTEQELDVLKGQAEYFGGALEEIRNRIEKIEKAAQTD